MNHNKSETPKSAPLNLPKPDVKNPDGLDTNPDAIPQRANLSRREPQILEYWRSIDLYERTLQPTEEMPRDRSFVLHDGPPFSNGDIHIGHAFNKILKDVAMKFRTMQGCRAPYVPGWDNNGLPIEVLVAKEFQDKKVEPTAMEIRHRCREVADQWFRRQRDQFERIGVRGLWGDPYLTFSSKLAARELEVFAELVEEGFIYRGLRPVYWSLVDRTALADHEVEYEDRTDPSIFVRFPLTADPGNVFGRNGEAANCYAIIWTTTPWTIPANVAIAAGPSIGYTVYRDDSDGAHYLIATERADAVKAAMGGDRILRPVTTEVSGRDLEGLIFKHALFDRDSRLVLADYVTTGDGAGLVHTAPGHGKEDFQTGQKFGLPTLQVLTDDGFFNADAGPDLAGLKVMAGRAGREMGPGQQKVLDLLESTGALLGREDIVHSYPHGWRSHDPLVFRATVQWFMNIDHKGHREKCLQAIKETRWYPADSVNRINAMVGGRPDWCLSRQRAWGVGIPVFYAQPSGTPLLTPETVRLVRDLVAERGTDAWFEVDAAEILPEGYRHPDTGETEFTKETDIFDVWFDSGSTCRTVLEQWEGLSFPADVYLEGGDQHRGWFNSSLMVGVATHGCAPYKEVVTNGWTLDENGFKMSKSKANGVAPQVVADKYGADVLRLWVCSTDYFGDVRVGDKILDQVATHYRTLRNTLRFTLGNLYDFDPAADAVAVSDLEEIDRWVLHHLNELVASTRAGYEAFEFYRVTQPILSFCTTDLSAFYLDIVKDRLYTYAAGSKTRRAAQTVLFELTSVLTRLLAPILSFTAEEVWMKLKMPKKPDSVLLTPMPSQRPDWEASDVATRWQTLLAVRDQVNKVLEGTKKPRELAITLSVDGETFSGLHPYLNQLPEIFLVSRVRLAEAAATASSIEVTIDGPAKGAKCSRCWVMVDEAGDDPGAACSAGCTRGWITADGGMSGARGALA